MLKSRLRRPPGGYSYTQLETGWQAPDLAFVQVVERMINHRRANPLKLAQYPVDVGSVSDELDYLTCVRLAHDPAWCLPDTQKKIPSEPSLPAPSRQSDESPRQSSPESVPLAGVEKVALGTLAIGGWILGGSDTVDLNLANARAKVCLECPLNGSADKLLKKMAKRLSKRILAYLANRKDAGVSVAGEDKLGSCRACDCYLPLKVLFPIKNIEVSTTEAVKAKLDPGCWILKELSAG